MNTRDTRSIPEVFIPKHRPKPARGKVAGPCTLTAAIAADAQRDRELAELDRLMRSNTCPWL